MVDFTLMYTPDSFKTSRALAIQPVFAVGGLTESMMHSEDPAAILYMTNILRLWSFERTDLPPTFVDEVEVTELSRQPYSIFVNEIEINRRELVQLQQPYSGFEVDQRPLSSHDPFELIPIEAGVFPRQESLTTYRVDGGEEIRECYSCNGAGDVPCNHCSGGRVTCPDCNGTQRVNCPRCLGLGQHLGARGHLINCQVCHGRQTQRCHRCTGGQITCGSCSGAGTQTCEPCQGHGNLHNYFQVKSTVRVGRASLGRTNEPWPLEVSVLANESDELGLESALWPDISLSQASIQKWLPPELIVPLLHFARQELARSKAAISASEQATGIRLRVVGGYLYSVGYQYRNESKRVIVGGIHNRVFSEQGAVKKQSLLGGIKRLSYHLVNAIADYTPPVDRKYLQAVRSGNVHIGDTRCLIPSVGKILNASIEISENGYLLSLDGSDENIVNISIDFNAAHVAILCLSRRLGIAERQKFAQAMQFNGKLAFGRIALSKDGEQEFFTIEERRSYNDIRPDELSKIIRSLVADSNTILAKRMLA